MNKQAVSRPTQKRPERVLMTTPTSGPVWEYALELSQGLSRLGIKVCLAAMGGRPTRAARAEARRVPGLELHESTYRLESMLPDPWKDVDAAANWLMTLDQRFKPDVIHLNNYAHGDVPWSAPVVMAAHSCLISQWKATRTAPPPSEYETYRTRVRAGLSGARVVVAPSKAMLDSLVEHYGSVQDGRVIPDGHSLGVSGPAPRKEHFVLAAGNLFDEARNVMILDQVAPRLGWPVYVAGDVESPESGAVKPAALQTLGRLHMRTLAGWMSRASIFADPARYEPFGLMPLAAAFAGCGLVLGDIPSLREVWEDAALFVPPDDTRALERALLELINNERRCRELAERAFQRAQAFQGCRMLASYKQLYGELLNPGEARRVERTKPGMTVAGEVQ